MDTNFKEYFKGKTVQTGKNFYDDLLKKNHNPIKKNTILNKEDNIPQNYNKNIADNTTINSYYNTNKFAIENAKNIINNKYEMEKINYNYINNFGPTNNYIEEKEYHNVLRTKSNQISKRPLSKNQKMIETYLLVNKKNEETKNNYYNKLSKTQNYKYGGLGANLNDDWFQKFVKKKEKNRQSKKLC